MKFCLHLPGYLLIASLGLLCCMAGLDQAEEQLVVELEAQMKRMGIVQ